MPNIPASGPSPVEGVSIYVLPPRGFCCICGVYSSYETTYSEELQPYMTEARFKEIIEDINDTLTTFWPCPLCICLGYLLAPVTCGLSLLMPRVCVYDAEHDVRKKLRYINDQEAANGVKWELCRTWNTSWIEIRYGDSKKMY
eukprot:172655_1